MIVHANQVILPIVQSRTNTRAQFLDPIVETRSYHLSQYWTTDVKSPDKSYGYPRSITVPGTFYFPTQTVNESWVKGRRTLNITQWTLNSERTENGKWAQTWARSERWVWMYSELKMNDLFWLYNVFYLHRTYFIILKKYILAINKFCSAEITSLH